MWRFAALAISFFAAAAPPSSPQALVIGTGLGKQCFDAVLRVEEQARTAERKCSNALKSEQLDTRNRAATYINRGIARMHLGRYDFSLNDFAAAKSLRPDLGQLYINEGAVLIRVGRYDDAIESLLYALEIGSADAHIAYFNLGLAREALGDISGAYFDLNRALELSPGWQLAERELSRFRIISE